jgi:hypothetical protein
LIQPPTLPATTNSTQTTTGAIQPSRPANMTRRQIAPITADSAVVTKIAAAITHIHRPL